MYAMPTNDEIVKRQIDVDGGEMRHNEPANATIIKREKSPDDILLRAGEANYDEKGLSHEKTLNVEVLKRKIDNEENAVCKMPRIEDYELIWSELQLIVYKLVSREDTFKVEPRESNDILFVISNDPDKITFFDIDYGSKKVETAIKDASKLLHPNGTIDVNLAEFLWQKRHELLNMLTMSQVTAKRSHSEWLAVESIVTNLYRAYTFSIPVFYAQSIEFKVQKTELSVIMSVDPNSLFQKLEFNIAQSKVAIGVSMCIHILECVLKQHPNSVSASFRNSRNKKIKLYGDKVLRKKYRNYYEIFEQVRCIVTKYWKNESDDQIEAFTILLMMESKMMNSKFLLFSDATVSKESMADIENELKICVRKLINVDKKPEVKWCTDLHNIVSKGTILAHVNLNKSKGNNFYKHLRQKLSSQSDSEICIHDVNANRRVIICSNLKTLKWLENTVNTFSTTASIDTWTQLEDDDTVRVIMLSSTRLTKPFHIYRDQIKKYNPNLRTELWTCLDAFNEWQFYMKIDVLSVSFLECCKRQIVIDGLVFKFHIQYVE